MCDNKSSCHNPVVISEDQNATRVGCTECKHQYVIRKDYRGIHENRQYLEIYRKDSLQPNTNLFYKYYPQNIRT